MRFISSHRLGVLAGDDMLGRNNALRDRPGKMRTPIGHDAVAAVFQRNLIQAAISDNRMEWRLDRKRVKRQ